MQLINIKHPAEQVSFRQAVLQGLGRDQGLYFPQEFKHFLTWLACCRSHLSRAAQPCFIT